MGCQLLLGGRCGSMLKAMVNRVGLVVACAVIAPLGLLPSSPAFAEGGGVSGHSSSNTDGGVTISVSVSYDSANPGSRGSGRTTTSSRQIATKVKPVCDYVKFSSGAELGAVFNVWKDSKMPGTFPLFEATAPEFQGWESHVNDNEGYWYVPSCSKPDGMSAEEFDKLSADYHAKNDSVFIPTGGQPPAPVIDGGTLAKAAWKAVEIPPPVVETNPRMDGGVQTLVGVENWVWASEDTPQSVTATATAGPVTATVTASSTGLTLSAPDSKVSCQGFGTPWQSGMAEGSSPCTMTFTRSSEHLGGTSTVNVGVSYSASYTATDGSQGDLPSVSTSGTLSIKVGEAQSLNTDDQK